MLTISDWTLTLLTLFRDTVLLYACLQQGVLSVYVFELDYDISDVWHRRIYCKTLIFRVKLFLRMANPNFREHVFFVNKTVKKTENTRKT